MTHNLDLMCVWNKIRSFMAFKVFLVFVSIEFFKMHRPFTEGKSVWLLPLECLLDLLCSTDNGQICQDKKLGILSCLSIWCFCFLTTNKETDSETILNDRFKLDFDVACLSRPMRWDHFSIVCLSVCFYSFLGTCLCCS